MGRNEIDPDDGIASGDEIEVDIGILLPFLSDLHNFDMLHRISALERTGNDLRQRIDINTCIDRQQNDRTVPGSHILSELVSTARIADDADTSADLIPSEEASTTASVQVNWYQAGTCVSSTVVTSVVGSLT